MLPEKGITKKEKILTLIKEGKYSDQEIAEIAMTAKANVYKKRSLLRSS